jgi:hypothetical protein
VPVGACACGAGATAADAGSVVADAGTAMAVARIETMSTAVHARNAARTGMRAAMRFSVVVFGSFVPPSPRPGGAIASAKRSIRTEVRWTREGGTRRAAGAARRRVLLWPAVQRAARTSSVRIRRPRARLRRPERRRRNSCTSRVRRGRQRGRVRRVRRVRRVWRVRRTQHANRCRRAPAQRRGAHTGARRLHRREGRCRRRTATRRSAGARDD